MNDTRLVWFGSQVAKKLVLAAGQAEKQTAQQVETDAQRLCPVGTVTRDAPPGGKPWQARKPGTLKNTIRVVASKYEGGGWLVIAGGYEAYYAPHVELGTDDTAPSPFMRRAKERNKKNHISNVRAAFKRAL